MPLLDILRKFGHPRFSISVGDEVLVESADAIKGKLVILGEVFAIEGQSAHIRKKHLYSMTGSEAFSCGDQLVKPIEHLKRAIADRIMEFQCTRPQLCSASGSIAGISA